MFTELIELSHKMKEEIKATQRKIKQNAQGIDNEGKETGTQVNDLEQKEEINIQLEQNEEKVILKNEERLRNPWTTLSAPTTKSQGFQEEKNKGKELKTYLNK